MPKLKFGEPSKTFMVRIPVSRYDELKDAINKFVMDYVNNDNGNYASTDEFDQAQNFIDNATDAELKSLLDKTLDTKILKKLIPPFIEHSIKVTLEPEEAKRITNLIEEVQGE